MVESLMTNIGKAFGECDGGKAIASVKGIITNRDEVAGEREIGQG